MIDFHTRAGRLEGLGRPKNVEGEPVDPLHQFWPDSARQHVSMLPRSDHAWALPKHFGQGCRPSMIIDDLRCGALHAGTLHRITRISKRAVTPCIVTRCNVRRMIETDWSRAREPHERLRWARTHAGFESAEAAATSLGMKAVTYRTYERAPDTSRAARMNDQRAIQFGRKFKVSWRWLLLGEGTPFETATSDAQHRVVQAMSAAPPEEQERIAAVVELMLKRTDAA